MVSSSAKRGRRSTLLRLVGRAEAAPRRADLDHPLDAQLSTRAARDHYLRENGFTVAAYDAEWTEASFFGLDFKVPNTPRHRAAIMLHDLHHVVTGYGTDLAGEGEISMWELRRGLRGLDAYVSAIVVGGALAGLLLYPRRALEAWRKGGAGRGNLFTEFARYDALLDQSVGELRSELGVPAAGVAEHPRGLHPNAPRPSETSVQAVR